MLHSESFQQVIPNATYSILCSLKDWDPETLVLKIYGTSV